MAEGTPGVSRPIRVIIADDHTVVRDGIRAVLQREAGEFEVVAEAADIQSMVRAVREFKPDLLTLDLTMPGGSCLAALLYVSASWARDGLRAPALVRT